MNRSFFSKTRYMIGVGLKRNWPAHPYQNYPQVIFREQPTKIVNGGKSVKQKRKLNLLYLCVQNRIILLQ